MSKRSWSARAFGALTQWIDHRVGWDKLPKPLGLLVLVGLRNTLRREEPLRHRRRAGDGPAAAATPSTPPRPRPTAPPTARTTTSASPRMGMAGARFGRNIPPAEAFPETGDRLMTPDPRVVSRRLLGRTQFQPATTREHAGRHLDPVHGQGLVQPRRGRRHPAVRADAAPRRPLARRRRCSSRARCPTRRARRGRRLPAHLRQQQHRLVGRLVDLRRQRRRSSSVIRTGTDGKLNVAADGHADAARRPARSTRRSCPASGRGWP